MRMIRERHGLAAKIAEVADVDPSFISKILAGEKVPSQKIIDAIPEAMLRYAREMDRLAFETEYPEVIA